MAVYECRNIGLYSYLATKGYEPFNMRYDNNGVLWLYESTPDLLMTITDFYTL